MPPTGIAAPPSSPTRCAEQTPRAASAVAQPSRRPARAILGPVLDGYGTWLLEQGYSTERVREHFCAARRLVHRLQQRGVEALTSLTRARLRALCSRGFAGGPQSCGSGAAAGAVLRVRAGAVSGARVDPHRAASGRLHDLPAAGPRVRARDRGAPRPHGERVSGPHRLRDPPDADRRARRPGSRCLSACLRPPPVACIPAARGGPPPSLPPVPGLGRRDPDRARHANRHAPRVSRREAPTGAALGHGSGTPPDDRPRESAGTPRLRDLPYSWRPTACARARS